MKYVLVVTLFLLSGCNYEVKDKKAYDVVFNICLDKNPGWYSWCSDKAELIVKEEK